MASKGAGDEKGKGVRERGKFESEQGGGRDSPWTVIVK